MNLVGGPNFKMRPNKHLRFGGLASWKAWSSLWSGWLQWFWENHLDGKVPPFFVPKKDGSKTKNMGVLRLTSSLKKRRIASKDISGLPDDLRVVLLRHEAHSYNYASFSCSQV